VRRFPFPTPCPPGPGATLRVGFPFGHERGASFYEIDFAMGVHDVGPEARERLAP